MDFMGGAIDVGLRVASLREKRGWTYRDLEEETKSAGRRVSASVLYRIEKGGQKVSVDDLVALCRAFDITPGEMLMSAEALDLREADSLLAALAQAVNNFWTGAQAAFVAGAELGAKFVHENERKQEIGEYVLNRLQHDLPKPEQVHPEVVGLLYHQLWEVLKLGHQYPARWADRVSRLEEARSSSEDALAQVRKWLAWGSSSGDDVLLAGLAQIEQEVVDTGREAVDARMQWLFELDKWEKSNPIQVEGEDV